MKKLFPIILFMIFFITSCGGDDEAETSSVSLTEKYQVNRSEGIPYAQALVGDWYDRSDLSAITLRADVYEPIGASVQGRPVMLYLHGGGFSAGGRADGASVNTSFYFASRGWVVFSIDYRLVAEPSLIPADWPPQSMVDRLAVGVDLTPNPNCSQVGTFASIPEGCDNISNVVGIDSEDDIPVTIGNYQNIYAATRDMKAAIRYIHATAVSFGLDTSKFTVMGEDAGATMALLAAVSSEGDFTDELTVADDPTLEDTTPEAPERITSAVSFFGSSIGIDLLNAYKGTNRYDANDASLYIRHGKQDNVISFKESLDVLCNYSSTGATIEFDPQCGGHSIGDTNGALSSVLNFIVADQNLTAE